MKGQYWNAIHQLKPCGTGLREAAGDVACLMKLSLPVNSKLTKYVIGLVLCVYSAKAVADAGFIEGGFYISIAREKVGATPTFAETTRAFLREASCPTGQSLHFRSRSLLRHAEVIMSHRSWFLSSLPRQGGLS